MENKSLLSKLCVGTAQFGMHYGIHNTTGQPGTDEVAAILGRAAQAGVQYIDTATAYGDAEKVLGDIGISGYRVKVISKAMPNLRIQHLDQRGDIEKQLRASLHRLRLRALAGYLLHSEDDFYSPHLRHGLQQCRDQGLVDHIGVSVYSTEHAVDVVKSGWADYIQVPYNIFDQGLDETEFFAYAKRNNVTVFARSCFLQGLLLMLPERIPDKLRAARKPVALFHSLCEDMGMLPRQAALLFSLLHPGIDYVVVGVEQQRQIQEIISDCMMFEEDSDSRQKFAQAFPDIPVSITKPYLWG